MNIGDTVWFSVRIRDEKNNPGQFVEWGNEPSLDYVATIQGTIVNIMPSGRFLIEVKDDETGEVTKYQATRENIERTTKEVNDQPALY